MVAVKTIVTGQAEENCYILYENDTALIVDPGADTSKIKNSIEKLKVSPLAILLTHTHFDHIGSVQDLRIDYDIPLYVHPIEQTWLGDPQKNLSAFTSHPIIVQEAEYEFQKDQVLEIENFRFKVVETPGHSPGSVSFIFNQSKFVLAGDALFAGSIGRTDLPGGSQEILLESIKKELFALDDHFLVYPGHGQYTRIGYEKERNPFFN